MVYKTETDYCLTPERKHNALIFNYNKKTSLDLDDINIS